jgi:ketosteroid isomerase-like protein
MSAEENNMALARRFMEARVKGDVDALDEMLPPDFVSHTKHASRRRPRPRRRNMGIRPSR